jgi:hypothetical protein
VESRPPYDTDLTDAEWNRLEPLVPAAKPGGRPVGSGAKSAELHRPAIIIRMKPPVLAPDLFKGRQFDHEIIVLCVRWSKGQNIQPSSRPAKERPAATDRRVVYDGHFRCATASIGHASWPL